MSLPERDVLNSFRIASKNFISNCLLVQLTALVYKLSKFTQATSTYRSFLVSKKIPEKLAWRLKTTVPDKSASLSRAVAATGAKPAYAGRTVPDKSTSSVVTELVEVSSRCRKSRIFLSPRRRTLFL